ncbi:MAG: D-glycero-beta-D-manno-heptose 1-phosphate adenylyltransferase [Gemmatimonadota bacterium]
MTEIPLLGRLPGLDSPRIVVFGDAMLDEYWWGSAERLSPEGPVPVLSLEERTRAPGGAANVARNVLALGARPVLVGAIGGDLTGDELREVLEELGVDPSNLVTEPGRVTPRKIRVGTRAQGLLRVDQERPAAPAAATTAELRRRLAIELAPADAAVVSDYAKGSVQAALVAAVADGARASGIDVAVDPKGSDPERFRGVTYLVPNERELRALAGRGWTDAAGRAAAAREVRERVGAEGLALTRSEHGVELHGAGSVLALTARAREVYDVTGAGDTFVAGFAVGLAARLSAVESCALGNAAAGVKVGKRGTAVVTRADLEASLARWELSGPAKRRPLEEVVTAVEALRREGRRIVFTNGCFDLLHAGHVRYLQASRALGDCLVVGLNGDASVRRLKGPGRPILSLDERARILSALACVDFLVAFDEPTPIELIRRIRPQVLTKGADYAREEIVGAELVEAWGGRVERVPLEEGASTTGLIERIRSAPAPVRRPAPRPLRGTPTPNLESS